MYGKSWRGKRGNEANTVLIINSQKINKVVIKF